jgi:hypothetical protein
MSSKKGFTKTVAVILGIIVVIVIFIVVISSMISNNAVKAEATANAEVSMAMAATEAAIPTATATESPTLEPSPTATMEATPEPSSTPIPPLGLIDQGFEIWSAPVGAGLIPASFDGKSDPYAEAAFGFEQNDGMTIKIPASFIVMEAHFNQVLPSGVQLKVYELDAVSPWYTATITPSRDDPAAGYFLIRHDYMVNPPFWEITYRVRLEAADGSSFWEKNVRFLKPTPNTCWDGSLPNPVTLYCPNYDGDWNYLDFENFNPNADVFTSGQVPLPDKYKK